MQLRAKVSFYKADYGDKFLSTIHIDRDNATRFSVII